VSLYAAPGSRLGFPVAQLDVPTYRPSLSARADVGAQPHEWMQEHHAYLSLMMRLARDGAEEFDVVVNNSLHHLPVAMAAACTAPMVTTLHTPPTPWLEPAITIADDPRSGYAAVSEHTRRAWRHVVDADVVPNGVDVHRWRQGPGGDALAWAGRLVPEKAPHLAIDIARSAGMQLRLAGPVGDPAYVREMVLPRLGPDVEYVGHLNTRQLGALFGASAATLVTPVWDEPYGLVAAESLACGTPVVAFERGGLPEFVTDDVGRVVGGGDVAAAADAVHQAVSLDRDTCRAHAVQHCSVERMVDEYLRIYDEMRTLRGAA
jgi:glycosyltransferase involved in cell wall biosynthesis